MMMIFCRNKYLKSVVCIVCVFLLVFLLVAAPLSVPAQAVAGIDDVLVFIAASWYLSMGYAFTVTPDSLQQVCNAFVSDMLENKGSGYDEMMEIRNRIEAAYEGGKYATVDIRRSEYAEISNAIEAWTKLHTSDDGQTITVDVANAPPILLKRENAYESSVDTISSILRTDRPASEAAFRNLFGNALVLYGNPKGYVFSSNYLGSRYSFTYLSCNNFGGAGVHGRWFFLKSDGTLLEPRTSCFYCDYSYPSDSGFAILNREGSSYRLYFGTINSTGNELSSSYTDVYSNAFSASIEGATEAVDVPVEKDKDYAGGVVAGNWDTLIGKVGSAADSLPFNIPMEGLGGLSPTDVLPKDLTQSGSVDVPDVGEGALTIPALGDLALPSEISSFFPFCLPFDLIRLVKVFAHDPKTPIFNFDFPIYEDVRLAFTIDLSIFDDVFYWVRLLLDVLFMAGLASATRKYIKW